MGTHDTLIDTAHQMLGDALEIECLARIRLADEYDAAQGRDEIAKQGRPKNLGDDKVLPSAADLGLRRDEIHAART